MRRLSEQQLPMIARDILNSVDVGPVTYLEMARAQRRAAMLNDNPYTVGFHQASRSVLDAIDAHNRKVGGLIYSTDDRLALACLIVGKLDT